MRVACGEGEFAIFTLAGHGLEFEALAEHSTTAERHDTSVVPDAVRAAIAQEHFARRMDKKQYLHELFDAVKKEVDLNNEETMLQHAACEGRIDLINEEFHPAYQADDGEAMAQNTAEKDELARDLADLLSEAQRRRIALETLVEDLKQISEENPSN